MTIAIAPDALDLIKSFEGYLQPLNDGTDRVRPYRCPADVPTIGFGSIKYPSGRRVQMSDGPITRQERCWRGKSTRNRRPPWIASPRCSSTH